MISRVTLLLVGDLRLVLQIPPGQVMAKQFGRTAPSKSAKKSGPEAVMAMPLLVVIANDHLQGR